MSNVAELSKMDDQAKRLLELLDNVCIARLDFDSREHLQVIGLCLDMAIDRAEKLNCEISARTGAKLVNVKARSRVPP